jgi:hypothetical protein
MKKKILFPFVGDSIGGSHISSLTLIEHLKKKGVNVKIVVHKKGIFYRYLLKKKIDLDFIPLKNIPGEKPNFISFLIHSIHAIPKVRKYLKKNYQPKIIHGNDLRINLTWSLSSMFLGKFIWHQRTIFKKKTSILGIYMFAFSKKIISISKTVKNSLPFYLNNITDVIYNPINIVKSSKITKPKIIYISKLTFNKGADHIYKLVKSDKFKNLIYIYGSGVYEKKFKKLKKKNIKLSNLFIKPINYFDQNTIVLCPSRYEGFGRILAEALIKKSKVIASDIPAHKEIKLICSRLKNFNLLNFSDTKKVILKIEKFLKLKSNNNFDLKLEEIVDPRKHTKKMIKVYEKL